MVAQIRPLPALGRSSLGAANDFLNHAKEIFTGENAEKLHVASLAPAFAEIVERFDKIINRDRMYVNTLLLSDADNVRDAYLGVTNMTYRANLSNPIQAKKAAAHHLWAKTSPYRRISGHQYTKESAEIRGLLALLEEEENAAAIETLGLTAEVAGLKEAEAEFERIWQLRVAEEKERAPQTSEDSKALMAEAFRQYEAIVLTVNAYAVVSPTEEILDAIAETNAQLTFFERILESKGSGSKGESDRPVIPDEGGEPTEPEEPTDPEEGEDDRPVIPEEPEEKPGKDENGDDLPPIE